MMKMIVLAAFVAAASANSGSSGSSGSSSALGLTCLECETDYLVCGGPIYTTPTVSSVSAAVPAECAVDGPCQEIYIEDCSLPSLNDDELTVADLGIDAESDVLVFSQATYAYTQACEDFFDEDEFNNEFVSQITSWTQGTIVAATSYCVNDDANATETSSRLRRSTGTNSTVSIELMVIFDGSAMTDAEIEAMVDQIEADFTNIVATIQVFNAQGEFVGTEEVDFATFEKALLSGSKIHLVGLCVCPEGKTKKGKKGKSYKAGRTTTSKSMKTKKSSKDSLARVTDNSTDTNTTNSSEARTWGSMKTGKSKKSKAYRVASSKSSKKSKGSKKARTSGSCYCGKSTKSKKSKSSKKAKSSKGSTSTSAFAAGSMSKGAQISFMSAGIAGVAALVALAAVKAHRSRSTPEPNEADPLLAAEEPRVELV